MTTLKFSSFAKINIGLEIKGKRKDGYHTIKTIFQTIDLTDEITLTYPSEERKVKCSHPDVPEDEENLVWLAAKRILKDEGFHIKIKKNIPVGSGLGGGSGNAGAVLLALSKLLENPPSEEKLLEIALKTGADVPFFLKGGTMLGEGTGEKLTSLNSKLKFPFILVVFPGIQMDTGKIYKRTNPLLTTKENGINISHFAESIPSEGKAFRLPRNELEAVACDFNPELRDLKKRLGKTGPLDMSMTGSGSAFYAVYGDRESREKAINMINTESYSLFKCSTLDSKDYKKGFIFNQSYSRSSQNGNYRS